MAMCHGMMIIPCCDREVYENSVKTNTSVVIYLWFVEKVHKENELLDGTVGPRGK